MTTIAVHELVSQLHSRITLEWVAGGQGGQRAIKSTSYDNRNNIVLVGHLNIIHPNRIQVLGKTELDYLEKLGKNSHDDTVNQLFSQELTAMVLITDGLPVPREFRSSADRLGISLLSCQANSQEVINHLQYLLGSVLANTTIIHGVFMDVMGSGVLLTGESGIGKSELALDLISRGHRLIADDAPEFSKIAPDIINGTCPEMLREFLEVRGLGILNVRALFGDSAIKISKYLRLVIDLEVMTDEQLHHVDRLRGAKRNRKILGINVPEVSLPVAPGRNLAIAVETAVRNHILIEKGYDAAEDFINRQNNATQKNSQ